MNCGLEVRIEGPTITRVRGDKAHPASEGYTCEKGLRIDHYQNSPHRLTTPLRRRPDGTFEAIDWDTAIAEVAQRFQDVIAEHGGDKILFYGGGGQGNHLGGGYGGATRSALGIRYTSNALAQEKTGEFWVDGQLFGRSRCHTAPDFEHAQVGVFWGKNPWQSHGIQQARRILKEFANDPARTLIVVDPRRTESADLADIHLRPLPGGDAHLLAAMLAILVARRPARRRLARRARQRARRVGRPPAHDRHRRVVRQGRRRRGRRAPRRARDRHGHRRRVGARGPRHPDGAALDAQQLPREAARAPHRQPRRAGWRQHPLALRRPARRRRRQPRPDHARHRSPAGDRSRAVQRDPRRDPHRPPRPVPGDARRVRQPGALAVRQPPDARGDARPRPRRRDRRGAHRDGPRGRLRAARRVAVREVGVHVLQPRVPAQRVPPAPAAVRSGAGHAARVRDPRPAVPRARRVRRRGRRAAAGGGRARPSRRSPRRSSRSSAPGRSSGGWRAC